MTDIKTFQPSSFESEMQELWENEKIYLTAKRSHTGDNSNKAYCLSMFPYPSGAGLHVGHVRIYTGTDVLARYFKMKGMDVLHPMGWDAFGLPAENAAIKAKKNPLDMVPGNIANFKRQMGMLGYSYDWSREFSTTDPSYYQWTQWLFIQFFKMGLLYKRNTPINFCPKCKTGLAEEEVLANGTHERCGSEITKKELPQWIFRITAYADRLLKDLGLLDWPRGILEMQRNWIGKKVGINITYKIKDSDDTITCFTTRPDTNFGATFIVIAPEHEFVAKILKSKTSRADKVEIQKYVESSAARSEVERAAEGRKKTGVFTGYYAINNLNGREMPIWISDFVLAGFGTGAVVGVPGHDLRDFEFAKAFDIEILRVVKGSDNDVSPITKKDQVQEEEGTMVNSSFLDGMDIHAATQKIMDHIEEKGWGKRTETFHLRDWIFSRQRYWGEPIPMVHCEDCEKNERDTNTLIIHGTWGNGEGNWFPWLTNHLKMSGVEAVAPTLPDSKTPDYTTRMEFIRKNYSNYTRPSSIVIGHSSGVGTALHIAQENKIDQLVLVAPVMHVKGEYKQTLAKAFDQKTADALDELYNAHPIDWDRVKKNVRKITVVFGEKDPYIPADMKKMAEDIFGVKNVHTVAGKAHFSSGTKDAKEQFELLRFIEIQSVKGWTMLAENELPLKLPYTASYEPTDTGESPLSAIEGYADTTCPRCGGKATRETDTMPNWAGSCWYFLRFAQDSRNESLIEFKESLKKNDWMPVDWYLGGAEHAVLHLLYARFWVKALYDLGYVDFPEPFMRLRNVGMVLAEDHRKMSKSWGNTINPDDVVAQFGADTLRVYEMFMAPFNMEIAWSTAALQGAHRFVKRIWNLYVGQMKGHIQTSNAELVAKLNKTIQKVGDDIAQTKFNTAIAAMMEFLNEYEARPELSREESLKFLQILAPFAPFVSEKLWRMYGEKTSVHISHWPTQTQVDIKETSVTVPVQINGKFRGTLVLQGDPSEERVEKAALTHEGLSKYLTGKEYKLIYVKGRIANFVVKL